MATRVDTAQREIVLVEDAHIRPMMGNQVLESLPSRHIPYSLVDPYILVDEGSLLFIRTGRGVLHAEGIGDDERRERKATEMRGLLFWVNLARKDKNVEPYARVWR